MVDSAPTQWRHRWAKPWPNSIRICRPILAELLPGCMMRFSAPSDLRDSVHVVRRGRLFSVGRRSLRGDEFFGHSTAAGIWDPDGARRRCRPYFPDGHDPGRLATLIGLGAGRGIWAIVPGGFAATALENILFKVKPLDPAIYFAVAGLLTAGGGGIVFCSRSARHAGKSDGRVANRVRKRLRSDAVGYLLPVVRCLSEWSSDWDERLREDAE